MIRRPPRSTLFPTRRSSDLIMNPADAERLGIAEGDRVRLRSAAGEATVPVTRSEEHTSELQSRLHLVCRLLLEKKKRQRLHADADKLDVPGAHVVRVI